MLRTMIFPTETELGQGQSPHMKPTHKATSQSVWSDARYPQLVTKTSRLILAALPASVEARSILWVMQLWMPKIVRQICHSDANITDSLFRQGQTQRRRGGRMHRFFRVVGFLYICEGSHAHYHATHAIVAAKSFDLCHPDGHHGDSKSRNYMETILRDSHQLYFAHILSNAW